MRNMRKASGWAFALLAGIFAVSLAGCGNDDRATGDDRVRLRAGTGLSARHAWWAATMVPWMERVEALTDGQVQFTAFTGGELVDVPHEIDALRNGTLDVALILPIYLPGEFPMAEVTMLPVRHSDTFIASRAWRGLLDSDVELANGRTYYESLLGAHDLKGFAVPTTQEYTISTTGVAFDSVARIRRMALRTPGRIPEMYGQRIGINTVTIPAVEMFDALSRGTLDGSFHSIADWSGYGFQDLFKYTLTDINFGHFNALIGMNQKTWDRLPKPVQTAMVQAHEEIFLAGAQEWVDRFEAMVKYNTGIGGTFKSIDDLDPAVQRHLLAGIEDTWLDYIGLLEHADLPGRQVALLWRDILVANGGRVPDAIAALK